MKKLSLLLLSLLVISILPAQKMFLSKTGEYSKLLKHPYLDQLIQSNSKLDAIRKDSANYNRLLVILVDFTLEEPDDFNTTGNGKFQLEPDPEYIYSIGAPPHNRQYYEANLDALKYYYLAVSAGSYELQYDVYPKDKVAYTLPKSMGYYNPPGASSELFVSRMEEYFKTAFELADSLDEEIDFASYSHYMIIHSGSDWQHDISANTPSDLPSFYIRVGDGKEAVVDNGTVLISHSCNVPETISQDFYISQSNGQNIHNGYGALNSVIAHEFGHSLGMVDLYNVYNSSPMVGVFDIMDSGGSGILVDELENGDIVYVEGALPTLPGAFSRNLMFRDNYLERGLLKEFPDFPVSSELSLNAISAMQNTTDPVPHTYKIPLNAKEYILVENRNVDPDGDGGTAVYGALDGRVVLYPTPFEDITPPPPTYEYDYLLPSFIKTNGSAIGGGILVWHINEAILYDEGQTDSFGNWTSNFDANTVNTNFYRKAVSIIEADGLTDLGSEYSMYWTGTPYDYFHTHKPILDSGGLFVNWSQELWKPELTPNTKPPLVDSFNMPGFYHLKQISNPSRKMSFRVESGLFDSTQILDYDSATTITGPVINSGFSEWNIPVLKTGNVNLLSNNNGIWQDLMGDYTISFSSTDYPLQRMDINQDGFWELVGIENNQLYSIDWANDDLIVKTITFPNPPTTTPLSMDNSLIVGTDEGIYALNNFVEPYYVSIRGIKCLAGYDDKIIALGENYFKIFSTVDLSLISEFSLPESFGNIEPLIYTNPDRTITMIFVMSNSGNLYRLYQNRLELIFQNHSNNTPGQLACTSLGDISPVLFFGIGNQFYALKADGTKLTNFPIVSYDTVSSWESPMALQLNVDETLFYPLRGSGYLAVDKYGKIVPDMSLSVNREHKSDYLFYNQQQQSLCWYYTDNSGKLYIHTKNGISTNPILFAGFRNGASGCAIFDFKDESTSSTEKYAYIYPNPVRKNYFKINLQNYYGQTKLWLYDISGTLIRNLVIPETLNNPRDFELSTKGLSSGVYIMILENGCTTKQLKFAIEK
ncbi:MAG: T9SS type A sorting domain-containing protein [Candidatus Cloacimonas sp.]